MREKKDVNLDTKLLSLAKKLQGLNTVPLVCKKLGVKEKTAINYIYELRKGGFVKTTRGRNKIRIYHISPVRRTEMGYPGLYDIINRYSPIKLAKPYEHRVYREISVEEAIVRALETGDFRTILASMALFKQAANWSRLYEHAKKKDLRRQVGALYDLSRKAMKVRRIDKRIEYRLLHAAQKNKFIVPGIKARDFQRIGKKWRIYLPFSKADLRRFKE